MRVPIYRVALLILAGVAFAQDTPPVQPKQRTESATPSTASNSSQGQSDRTAGQTSGTTSGENSGSRSGSMSGQSSGATGAQASGKSGAQGSDRLQEMKTQTYSGTLMDASCAKSGSAGISSSSRSSTGSSAGSAASTPSADRSAGSESNQSCTVSASTTQFALKIKDGNTVKFDDVGNLRVQEAMKTRKMWSDSASVSKPIRVKASGVLNGDKLTVLSVN